MWQKNKTKRDHTTQRPVTFRCSDEEMAWLTKESKRYHLTRSRFAKLRAFGHPLTLIPKFSKLEL